jgi:hypothetical protein
MVSCLDSTVETFIARNKRIIIQYQSVDGKKNTKNISIPKATILLDTIENIDNISSCEKKLYKLFPLI